MLKTKSFWNMISGLFLIMIISMGCAGDGSKMTIHRTPDPFERNRQLDRGINLGNALDAPAEGEWGVVLKEEYFKLIKEAGFDSVRIPVRWSNHALAEAPYTIDPVFLARVDWAVDTALAYGLPVILNIHHYRELYTEPAAHRDRFMGLWKQIAEHYKNYPDALFLEILNEPDDALTPEMWNQWLKEAHAIIRKANPTKTIVIGSANDNWITYLEKLELPEDDRNIIVTVHHYFPHEFTHQGADWVSWDDSGKWLGTAWTGTDAEKKAITEVFDIGAAWSRQHNRPINLGEFGAYEKADMDSRARWTRFMADSAIRRGWSFHYWEFCAQNFGIYSDATKEWKRPLLNALIPPGK